MSSAPKPAGRRDRGAPWRVVLVIAGLALAGVLLIRLGIDREFGAAVKSPPSEATAVVAAADAPIIFSGVGSQTSAPFYLAGGTYRGKWSAWGQAAEFPPCHHLAELLAVDPDSPESAARVLDLVNLESVPATGASAEIYLYDLKPGEYYLGVTSECGWQVALSAN